MADFRVKISNLANESLEEIYVYIERKFFNSFAAKKQVERLMLAAKSLSVFPKMHRVRKIHPDGSALRFFPVDNYLIIYCVDDIERVVKIFNVVYNRRNLDTLI